MARYVYHSFSSNPHPDSIEDTVRGEHLLLHDFAVTGVGCWIGEIAGWLHDQWDSEQLYIKTAIDLGGNMRAFKRRPLKPSKWQAYALRGHVIIDRNRRMGYDFDERFHTTYDKLVAVLGSAHIPATSPERRLKTLGRWLNHQHDLHQHAYRYADLMNAGRYEI